MGEVYQETEGAYIYARNTFGPMVGFIVCWMMLLSAIIGWAAMVRGVNTFLTLILSLTGTFEYLISACVLVSILPYIPTCLAVIVLRRKRPDISKRFTIPGGYIIPCLALLTCIWILLQGKLNIIIATLGGVASLPLYYFRNGKETEMNTN